MMDDMDAVILLHAKIDEIADEVVKDWTLPLEPASKGIVTLRRAAEYLEKRYQ